MMHILDIYYTQYKNALIQQFQYRVTVVVGLLRILVEPVVYLVAWQTAAAASGGSINGYTADDFAVYFIAWMLVRQMTVGWDPNFMEWRIKEGEFTPLLLRPVHPIHADTAMLMGWKAIELIGLVPTIGLMVLIFHPQFHFVGWSLAAFVPALILGFALRYLFMYALAMLTFWTTRVQALYRAYFLVEFFVSGRIAPLGVLPEWLQTVAGYLPFQWMFAFPLELLLGNLTPTQALNGFAMQGLWLVVSVIFLMIGWRFGIRQYSAVGG